MRRSMLALFPAVLILAVSACRRGEAPDVPRVSGYVEATEVRVASKVPGRVETVTFVEGARVAEGETLVTLSTTETDHALRSRACGARPGRRRTYACSGQARGPRTFARPKRKWRPRSPTSAPLKRSSPRPGPMKRASNCCSRSEQAPRNSATMRWRGESWRRRECGRQPIGRPRRRPPLNGCGRGRARKRSTGHAHAWPWSTPRSPRSIRSGPMPRSSLRCRASSPPGSSSRVSSSPQALLSRS